MHRSRGRVLVIWGVLAALCSAGGPCPAQEDKDLEERLRLLEQRLLDQEDRMRESERTIKGQMRTIKGLKKRLGEMDIDEKDIQMVIDKYLSRKKQKGELFDIAAGYDKAFYLASSDKEFRLEIGGFGQYDLRIYGDGYPADSTFTVRKTRISLSGYLWKHYEFKITEQLEGESARLDESYLNINYLDELEFRVGQFKEPFGIDQISPPPSPFAERALSSDNLYPGKDIGAAFHGKILKGVVNYGVGIFNGTGRNRNDNNDDKDMAARLAVKPFRTFDNFWTKGIQLGGSITYGTQDDKPKRLTLRSAGDTPFFELADGVNHEDELLRLGADAGWDVGPASLEAEWVRNDFDLIQGEVQDVRLGRGTRTLTRTVQESLTIDGFYGSAAFLLTGEEHGGRKAFEPKNPFDPANGGWGAWELGARYGWIEVRDEDLVDKEFATGSDDAESWAGVANWHLNKNVRITWHYEYTRFGEPVAFRDSRSVHDEHFFVVRFQFNF